MVRGLLALALLVGALGCGNEEEIAQLKHYSAEIHKLDQFNRRVQAEILRFDDPTQDITRADIQGAFDLLEEYQKAVAAVTAPDAATASNTHDLYVRSFDEAMGLASDEKGDTKRRTQSAAIGLRDLRRKLKDRVYPTFNLLMAREKLTGEQYELVWPESD